MNSSAEPCPMCGEPGAVSLASRTKSEKTFQLALCGRCGQHFCSPTPTIEQIVGFYQGNYHSELREPGATEKAFGPKCTRYRDWVTKFVQSGRSIDLGTATGLLPSLLKQAGFAAEGTDYDRASAEWGAAHYGVPIRVGGLEQIASDLECFDLITMTDVLEHMQHPLHALQTVKRSLKPRGYMLITFPDIRSVESRYQQTLAKLTGRDWIWACCRVPVHLWEFTPATARAMFHKAGFDVLGFQRSHQPELFSGLAGLLTLPLHAIRIPAVGRLIGSQMEFIIRKRDEAADAAGGMAIG